MLNKIHKEMNDFSHNIKTIKSHEELLAYINSNFYASIKLLFFSSKTFSLYGRIMLIFVIALTVLLILSIIEAMGARFHPVLNPSYILAIILVLFFLIFEYIIHCKKFLILSIEKSKSFMEKAEK